MNDHNVFITAIEKYYEKKYTNDLEVKIIQEYLKSKIITGEYDKFFEKVVMAHSKKWNSLPDIAIFEEIFSAKNKIMIEMQAEDMWRKLLPVGALYDVFIVDPYANYVIRGYGSWDKFCQNRDGEYREFFHREFVKKYICAYLEKINETPTKLFGHLSEEYPQS